MSITNFHWQFQWIHIPTGKTGVRIYEGPRQEFLTNIAKWNSIGFGRWQYRELSGTVDCNVKPLNTPPGEDSLDDPDTKACIKALYDGTIKRNYIIQQLKETRMVTIKYSGHNPPWKQENRLPTMEEIQEISGYIGRTEDSNELENLSYAAIEAALSLFKVISEK